ncbi:FimV/HubP family polar landmark protein [Roseateles aquatilis]|uniref:FimV/HubP family polar landmark protein n=1 Tax=Roseateles aquatilis TaxID=431061 RepID=UPI001EDF794F|nr:FimV/HubP family polar landmark protein [Roseateles aquatilis]
MKKHASAYARFALSQVAAVTALGLAAGSAWGLGLGKLTVQSALGETLRAEIDVSSLTTEEASSLKLRVAPPESYRSSGLDYNAVLASAQVQLARRADGRPYLRLTSDRAVQEPFVDVILELNWASGRLTREFTLLFDPPSNTNVARAPEPTTSPVISAPAPAPAAPAAPVARTQPPVASAPVPAPAPAPVAQAPAQPPAPAVTARPRPTPAPAPAPAATPATAASEYTVKPGDTLSRIAARSQSPGVSLDQMLVGLYRSNPDAFINENMNRLKSGAVLSVPGSDSVQSITPQEARRVIQAQSSDFGGYRQRLAEAAPTLKPKENERQAKGQVQAAVEDRKPSASPTPDKLTLSKPTTTAAETKVSKETEKKDSAARVAELTRNVEELKKLSAAAKPSAPVAAAPAPAPAPTPAPTPTPTPVVPPPVTVAANVPAASTTAASAAAVAETPASRPAAASAPKVVPAQPEVEEPSFLDSLSDYLPALGAALLVIVGGVGYNRWRARRDAASRSETAFAESRLAPDSFFGHSGGQRVDTRDASTTGQSSMSYSLSQLDAIGDVDPVAEADVYLAYGRDLQAEEILKEALRANPERLAIRLKLLEVYGKRRDIKGFEQLAVQLYAETKGQGEDWSKVQELGRQVDPENPLYQPGGAPVMFESDDERPEPMNASTLPAAGMAHPGGGAIARAAAAAAAVAAPRDSGPSSLMDLDLDLDLGGTPPPPSSAMAATQALPTSAAQAPMNMDLDLSAPPAASATSASAHELEFDLGDLDDLGGGKPAASGAAQAPESLDFDLSSIDLDLPAAAPASRDERTLGRVDDIEDIDAVDLPDLDMVPAAKAPVTVADTMSLDDLGVGLDSIDPNDDEALQRQLELAEEFRQIGDTEGARDVLQELVGKAAGPLRDRAQQMLDQLR